MPWIATAATVISAGLNIYGSLKQSQAERELGTASAQAQVDAATAQRDAAIQESKNLEFNAQIQRNQAIVEEVAGARERDIFREDAEAFQARQRTQFAFAGLAGGGSVAAVLEDTANKIQDDLAQLGFETRARALAIRQGAELTERQAASVRRAGDISLRTGLTAARATRRAASTRAGTSLLSGALSTIGVLTTGFARSRRLRT